MSAKIDLVLRSQNVMTDIGARPASIAIADGKVVTIGAFDQKYECTNVYTSEKFLLPGVVDSHVHRTS